MWGRGGGDGRAEEEAPRRRLPTGRSGISERDEGQGDDLNSSGGHRSPEVSRRSTEMTLKNKKDENKRKKKGHYGHFTILSTREVVLSNVFIK
jgi:hypothetical protein